jgi:hypothetical protein
MSELWNPKNNIPGAVPENRVETYNPDSSNAQQVTNFEDTDDYSSMSQEVEVGQKASDFPIEKFKAVRGRVKRIGILTRKWKSVKIHFENGIGFYYCFDGTCCQTEKGPAKWKYLIPVVEYMTDEQGNVLTLDKFKIKFMSIGSTIFDHLSALDQGFKLETIDINVSTTNEKMQQNSYVPVGPAVWRKPENIEFTKLVAEEYKKLEKYILKAAGRKLGNTPEEMQDTYTKIKAKLAGQQTGITQNNNYNAANNYAANTNPTAVTNTVSAPSPVNSDFNIDEFLN